MAVHGGIRSRSRASQCIAAVVVTGIAVCGVLGTVAVAQAAKTPPPAPAPVTRAQQWYLNQFDMNAVWKTSRGSGVTVAIVGSGVDVGQSDISGAALPQLDFSTGSPKPAQGDVSPNNDATAAAVLIAGSGLDKSGIEGIAPKAKLLPLRYYADAKVTPTPAYAAQAIRYAADHGARVIVMPAPAAYNTTSLADAVGYALGKDAIVITSASNNGLTTNQITSPCTVRGTVCVSGTTQNGTVWQDSSTGSEIALGAPAENLPVWAQNKYGIHSSTHYSAALVAGEAALVLGAHPMWTAGQVISVMIDTASGGNAAHTRVNDAVGYGVMNPAGALAAPQPASTGNPLAPSVISSPTGSTPTAKPSAVKSVGNGVGTTSSSRSSQGTSPPWMLIGFGAAAVFLVGVLLLVLLRRRRGEGRNYLSDPAYQAGRYFNDSGWYGPDDNRHPHDPPPAASPLMEPNAGDHEAAPQQPEREG